MTADPTAHPNAGAEVGDAQSSATESPAAPGSDISEVPATSDSPAGDEPDGDDTTTTVTFASLGLGDDLLAALGDLGYEEPTPIQAATIPALLTGRDLIGQAATGTGKTAAFSLPLLERLDTHGKRPRLQALVLVPTRELAMQVSEAMFKYGRRRGISVVPVYGGQPIGRQLQALERGVHVVVGTPGRVLDHLKRGSLVADTVDVVVLDEADEMLDMGFAEDLEAILAATPGDRQTVLFSATMPPRIEKIAGEFQRDPLRLTVSADRSSGEEVRVTQRAYLVSRRHKPAALGRILDIEEPRAALVFCRTRTEVDVLTETMNGRGYRAEALHGGMDQAQRDRVMHRLREGTSELLIATDVAARGLDVDLLTHVVNYDAPSSPETYVHRIGRVGRAGREGVAITLAEPRERRLLSNIERFTGARITLSDVPTIAELRARQAESTVAAVLEAVQSGDLDEYTEMFNALTVDSPHTYADVTRAALKLVHQLRGNDTAEDEIPAIVERPERANRRERDNAGAPRGDGGERQRREHSRPDDGRTGFIYISLGRNAGVRPADLVGAVAGESGLRGAEIGPIRISDYSSVVGVPVDAVERVISAMDGAMIRGKAANVRRFTPNRDRDSRNRDGGDRDRGTAGGRAARDWTPRRDRPSRREDAPRRGSPGGGRPGSRPGRPNKR